MKILIIGPSWIGDAIISHSLYQLIKKSYPDSQIDVIAPPWNSDIFKRMKEIHNIFSLKFLKHGSLPLKKYYQFAKNLQKNNQYQQAIILPNSFKSGLIPFFAKIPKRTGWLGELRYGLINDLRILNKIKFPLLLQRYAALAFEKKYIKHANDLPQPLLYPNLQCSSKEIKNTCAKFKIYKTQQIVIGLCPGAEFSLAKQWPQYHYATLTLRLIKQEYQVILFGSNKEKNIGQNIKQYIPKILHKHLFNLIGMTSLHDVIPILKICTAIISNDSGLMHAACALQRPVIALYGPSNPNYTPPLHNQAKIIKLNQTHPTIQNNNKYKNKYHPSLINIQPQIVLEKLNTLLKKLKQHENAKNNQ